MSSKNKQLSFDNTEFAFAYKSNKELKKAHFLFKLMGKPLLVKWGLVITPLAIRYKIPFTKKVIRKTIFEQFVGGENLEQTAKAAEKLSAYGVEVILDYGVEGGEGELAFDLACNEFIKVVDYAALQSNIPFISIKVTGVARFGLLEKIDELMRNNGALSLMERYEAALKIITEDEKQEWKKVVARIEKICAAASQKKVGVLIDAEESWIQDPVDAITMAMMERYNPQKAIVYNTIQLYRHDRLAFLKASHEVAKNKGFVLGAKLVRGAYMEKERARAAEKGYASPIQANKEATDRDYNLAIEFCLQQYQGISMIVASHNEYSNSYAAGLVLEKAASLPHPVNFSQLYGMSDNITFNLAKAGFAVSKYLPFGPIKDVIPYLMRRAQENSSVAGQTGRELGLIKKELQRRG